MSHFQTQTQWENSAEQEESIANDSASAPTRKENGIQVSKKGLIISGSIIVLVILGLLAIYMYGRSVEGIWVRQMDDNSTLAGMTVEVKRDGAMFEGVIIDMPSNAYAFEVGQVKWHLIKKVGFGKYEYYDLSNTDGTNNYFYDSVCSLTVLPGGKQLTISTSGSNARGNHQIWIKQK